VRCNVGVGKEGLHLPRRPGPGGRLPSVSDGTNAASCGYLPQAGLVERIRFSRSGQDRLTTTRQFDLLNRLSQIAAVGPTGSTLSSFSYTYNEANQRVRMDVADGSVWSYQ